MNPEIVAGIAHSAALAAAATAGETSTTPWPELIEHAQHVARHTFDAGQSVEAWIDRTRRVIASHLDETFGGG